MTPNAAPFFQQLDKSQKWDRDFLEVIVNHILKINSRPICTLKNMFREPTDSGQNKKMLL